MDADITIHIDETLDHDHLQNLCSQVKETDGVHNIISNDDRPHLIIVKYNSDETHADKILKSIKDQDVHAELVGM